MKKAISLILALTLVFALGVPAIAANTTGGEVTISTSVDETYTVTIPSGTVPIIWGTTSTTLGSLTLSAARFDPGYGVTVAASSGDDGYKLKNGDAEIAYTLKAGADAFTSTVFDEVNDTVALTIDISQAAWNAASAGSYADTITFTVTYGEIGTP